MAWTTPRTWKVGEMVTAAYKNAQVRDNETYLKDQFSTTTGHDHDGANSAKIMPSGFNCVSWVPGSAAVQKTYEASATYAARPHVDYGTLGPYVQTYEMVFPVTPPLLWRAYTTRITEIKLYCYLDWWTYVDAVYLRYSDLDGTYTDAMTYAGNLWLFGLPGQFDATIFSGSLIVPNYPLSLVLKLTRSYGSTVYEQTARIYGFKFTWEL